MKTLTSLMLLFIGVGTFAQTATKISQFPAAEARQAVAVDEGCFYAIDNSTIGKYDKQTGKKIATWTASKFQLIKHLNSGVVIDGKLYCAQSNYPQVPRTSSIEIWDAERLEHIAVQSFGIADGAANWIDYHDGSWWVLFAHYSGDQAEPGRDAYWTRLDRFDDNWCRTASYVLPKVLVDKMTPKSCSGGAWGPDGFLYVTGHDAAELYKLSLPVSGAELHLINTIPLSCEGQGIAFDTDGTNYYVYSILRKTKQVVVSKFLGY